MITVDLFPRSGFGFFPLGLGWIRIWWERKKGLESCLVFIELRKITFILYYILYRLFSTMMRIRWRTQSWSISSWSTTVIRPTMFSTCSTSHPTKELSHFIIAFTESYLLDTDPVQTGFETCEKTDPTRKGKKPLWIQSFYS